MFNLAIDSKLRGCDVVNLRVEDVASHGRGVDRATVRQKKTGQPVRFELTEQTREAVDAYIKVVGRKPGQFLFLGRRGSQKALTTRQYARLVAKWVASIGLDPSFFGTHSLRRTKATLIYRRTGNLRAVQLLLGHTKIHYLPRGTMSYEGNTIDTLLSFRAFPRSRDQQKRDEIPASHSISSSARASNAGGTVRPIALAVLRFTTKSNFAGCSIGRSWGRAPCKIFEISPKTCRKASCRRVP